MENYKKFMKKAPKVSVVMPCYNVENTVGGAIESILNQTLTDFEFIIIDDGSSDNTLKVIKEYARKDKRIIVLRNKKNMKIAGSLNKGIRKAKASYIARMDADDWTVKDRLMIEYKYLNAHPSVAVVGGNMLTVDKKGRIIGRRDYPERSADLKKVIFRYNPFGHPTTMFRKSVFEEFGGYSTDIYPCEDYDLWIKIGSKYDFYCIQKHLLKWTFDVASSTHFDIKRMELIDLRLRLNAILKYGYSISLSDIVFNVIEYVSMWLVPAEWRIRVYYLLRSKGLI